VGRNMQEAESEELLEAEVAAAEPRQADASEANSTAPNRWKKLEPVVYVIVVTFLAIASLAAAWSAYQTAFWDREQAAKYAEASAKSTESAQERTCAHHLTIVDITTFENFNGSRNCAYSPPFVRCRPADCLCGTPVRHRRG
jgi:hypothetical protein